MYISPSIVHIFAMVCRVSTSYATLFGPKSERCMSTSCAEQRRSTIHYSIFRTLIMFPALSTIISNDMEYCRFEFRDSLSTCHSARGRSFRHTNTFAVKHASLQNSQRQMTRCRAYKVALSYRRHRYWTPGGERPAGVI
jgi:hypothetical protein